KAMGDRLHTKEALETVQMRVAHKKKQGKFTALRLRWAGTSSIGLKSRHKFLCSRAGRRLKK
ncbi:hypothetical protein ACCS64_38190, partial [Rhizobium ruizarguesonis]